MSFIPRIYTVESVRAGHPDKVCDQISDAILDECLKQDPQSRVAVETFGSAGLLVIGGELTTRAQVDYEAVARRLYGEIGYSDDLRVIVNVVKQSPDIAQGVNTGGAGDQGIMYGFATDETSEFLPRGLVLVHSLVRRLDQLFKAGALPWLGPDGKAQVTMEDGVVKTVLVSCQHTEDIGMEEIRSSLQKLLFSNSRLPAECWVPLNRSEAEVCPALGEAGELEIGSSDVEVLINPTGRFVRGGFAADTGLTGRKIMVDTYGGLIPHGGGAFSGKDPTKVDRSAAYMARYAAKQLAAEGYGHEVLVSVAYAIGQAEPVMLSARNEAGQDLSPIVKGRFDFRPQAMIEYLNLREPHYRAHCIYSHFTHRSASYENLRHRQAVL